VRRSCWLKGPLHDPLLPASRLPPRTTLARKRSRARLTHPPPGVEVRCTPCAPDPSVRLRACAGPLVIAIGATALAIGAAFSAGALAFSFALFPLGMLMALGGLFTVGPMLFLGGGMVLGWLGVNALMGMQQQQQAAAASRPTEATFDLPGARVDAAGPAGWQPACGMAAGPAAWSTPRQPVGPGPAHVGSCSRRPRLAAVVGAGSSSFQAPPGVSDEEMSRQARELREFDDLLRRKEQAKRAEDEWRGRGGL